LKTSTKTERKPASNPTKDRKTEKQKNRKTEKQNMQLHIKNVRMSFAHIRTPQKPTQPDELPKFKFNGIVSDETRISFTHGGKSYTVKPSDMPKVELLLLKEKFGNEVKRPAAPIWASSNFLYNVAEQQVGSRSPKIDQESGDFYDGYEEGTYFFSASAPEGEPPLVVDQKRRELAASSGHPENGDYVNVIIDAFAYEYKNKKGLSGTVKGVQYLRDGEKFGAARGVEASAFDEEELDDDLEEMSGDDAFPEDGFGGEEEADDSCF
jgi:hypothetical protein